MFGFEIIFRLVLLLLLFGVVAGLVLICRKKIKDGTRLALDFSLLMYGITFYVGICWIFIGQGYVIDSYYGGVMRVPDASYVYLLLLATAPFILVPLSVIVFDGLFSKKRKTDSIAEEKLYVLPVLFGILFSLVLVFLANKQVFITLINNVFFDFRATVGIDELYAKRQELFDLLSSLQAGLIYGTLPACAAILLFFDGPKPLLIRCLGLLVAFFAVVANIGLFQIGPVMVFGLTCLFCYFSLHRKEIKIWKVGLFMMGVLFFLAAYHEIKIGDGGNRSNIAMTFAMRMPIAMPYLLEMSKISPELIRETDSLPHELGEYMFPEITVFGKRFVSMPMPAFVDAWFSHGVFLSALILILVGIIIAMCGQFLAIKQLRTAQSKNKLLMASIISAPVLYYLFQVSFIDFLFSSYSVAYVAIPALLIVMLNKVASSFCRQI